MLQLGIQLHTSEERESHMEFQRPVATEKQLQLRQFQQLQPKTQAIHARTRLHVYREHARQLLGSSGHFRSTQINKNNFNNESTMRGRRNVNATTEIVDPKMPINSPMPGVTTTYKRENHNAFGFAISPLQMQRTKLRLQLQ